MLPSGMLTFSPRKRVSHRELPVKGTKEKQTDVPSLAFQPNGPTRPLDPLKPMITQRSLNLTNVLDKKNVAKKMKKAKPAQKKKGSVHVNSIKKYLTSSVTTSSSPLVNELKLDTTTTEIIKDDKEDGIPCVVRRSTSILSLLPTFLEEFNPTIETYSDEYAALLEADKALLKDVVQVEPVSLVIRQTVSGMDLWDEMMGSLDSANTRLNNEYLTLLKQDKDQGQDQDTKTSEEIEAENIVPQISEETQMPKSCKVRHNKPIMSLWPIFEDSFEVHSPSPTSPVSLESTIWTPRHTTSLTALWSMMEGDLQSSKEDYEECDENLDIRPYALHGKRENKCRTDEIR
ncbi:hypothetical protein J3Q64DRAFT_1451394 [Phycomyces blakesleeanus]|uniref:Uncharacterized protein n=1 Tax=Phycomyces blakesleeanus TaxID=4837 RepID=A0ABR3B196_PHYBL